MPLVVDTNITLAAILGEPEKSSIEKLTIGEELTGPSILPYEIPRKNFASMLNTALTEEVIISRRDGSLFKIVPIKDIGNKTSPLNVKSIQCDITLQKILSTIRESRNQE